MYKKRMSIILFAIGLLLLNINSIKAYESYKFGDKLSFKKDNYYVLENSDENTDYVYVLKEKPLNSGEIYKYGRDSNGEYLFNKNSNKDYDGSINVSFYTSDSCYLKEPSYDSYELVDDGCQNDFQNSDVKKILDNWKKDTFKKDELKVVNGYDVRLLSTDDLTSKFGFEYYSYSSAGDINSGYNGTGALYEFINGYERMFEFWIMDGLDNNRKALTVEFSEDLSRTSSNDVYRGEAILPSLYIKKCAFNDTCIEDDSNDDSENINYNSYSFGEKVKFRGEDYYVLKDSDSKTDYITLIKDKPLTINDIQKYGQQANGERNKILYNFSSSCNEYMNSFFPEYDNSNVQKVVDGWANDYFYEGELKKVNDYKARILDYDFQDKDIVNYTSYPNSRIEQLIKNNWHTVSEPYHYVFYYCLNVFTNSVYLINPVINLKKCTIEGTCVTNKKEEYNSGDLVTYKGETYHVLKNSDKYTNYVTLLKDEPLTRDEISRYFDGEISDGEVSGKALVNFTYNNNNSYNKSIVSEIVDKWASDEFDSSLVSAEKYASKILSTYDLVQYLGYEWGASPDDATRYLYTPTEDTPDWFTNGNYSFWLLTPYEDSLTTNWVVSENSYTKYMDSKEKKSSIRPVVNVNKCILNPNADNCQKCKRVKKSSNLKKYKEFSVGDEISYNDEEYYVIENSSEDTSYLKLLKKDPLISSQINNYGKDINGNTIINRYTYYNEDDITNNRKHGRFAYYYHEETNKVKTGTCEGTSNNCVIEGSIYYIAPFYYNYDVVIPGQAYEYENGFGGMQYYSDSICALFNGTEVVNYDLFNDDIDNPCLKFSDYDLSNIKTVIENWQNNKFNDNDLVNIDGYKARLLNKTDYQYLKDSINDSTLNDWLLSDDYPFWIMGGSFFGGRAFDGTYIGTASNNPFVERQVLYPTVRPVIFLNKCVLDGACFDETIDLAYCYKDEEGNIIPDVNDDPDNPSIIGDDQIVDSPNTSKIISTILIVLSCGMIISGIIIFTNSFYINQKERKKYK